MADNIEKLRFKKGDKVWKTSGYSYSGEVRAAFHNRKGAARYVVEMIGSNGGGMLHIFNANQLALHTGPLARTED